MLTERGGHLWHVPSLGHKHTLGTFQDVLENKAGILKVPIFNMQDVKVNEDGLLDLGNLTPQSQSLDIHNQTNVYIW